ncbi:Ca2+-binding EF-hand superfamily protein [Rhodovulum iodosum]|uniref:Ca2+-binding EF-hand superfamily protein n=1 Tax=Rhodovulum iodosum TaxID=68291 RepID=A0ABV3XN35_9RHOB|nr:hypothetical protein [Rhodovulum robiginosum]RSK35863.1 hypothetical protein EJA01_05820 [Rhodovulum robiginosum]
MQKFTILATAFALGTGAAFAADSLDADGDGAVSFEEMLAVYPATTEEDFSKLDADADGTLSADEVAAAEEAGMIPAQG